MISAFYWTEPLTLETVYESFVAGLDSEMANSERLCGKSRVDITQCQNGKFPTIHLSSPFLYSVFPIYTCAGILYINTENVLYFLTNTRA